MRASAVAYTAACAILMKDDLKYNISHSERPQMGMSTTISRLMHEIIRHYGEVRGGMQAFGFPWSYSNAREPQKKRKNMAPG